MALAASFDAPDMNMMHARRQGARKHSGGRPKNFTKGPRYRAWKKVFGGIARPMNRCE